MKTNIYCGISLIFIQVLCSHTTVRGSCAAFDELTHLNQDTSGPRDFVISFNNMITDQRLLESFDELLNKLTSSIDQCHQFKDTTTCLAGLYFTGGYMYQQALFLDPGKYPSFRDSAEHYYERSLGYDPDDPLTWSNLSLLLESHDLQESTIKSLIELAEKYPNQRTQYLIRIGDLLLKDKKPDQACVYFNKAYQENPWSEQACQRMVSMYQVHRMLCSKKANEGSVNSDPIWEFAYQCVNAGFPNLGEEVFRQQIVNYIEDQKWKYANQSIILWADLLARNKWLDPKRVEDLRYKVGQSNERSPEQHMTDSILVELIQLIKAKNTKEMKFNGFWAFNYSSPRSEFGYRISPSTVFVRLLHSRGEENLFRGNFELTKAFWDRALKHVDDEDPMCLKIAKDLIELYELHPELDPGRMNAENVIDRLFQGKMLAIRTNNDEVRRRFHALLGSIYYKRGKDSGDIYKNSKYQLEHALESNEIKYIVDPEIRRMLSEVYERTKRPKEALAMRIESMKDLLIQDRISAAKEMGEQSRNLEKKLQLKNDGSLEVLEKISAFRNELASSDSASINSKQINDIYEIEKSNLIVDKDFMNGQVFKMIADLGEKIESNRIQEKQKVYSEALTYLNTVNSVSSISDYRRLVNIKTSLEKSVDHPMLMQPVVYKNTSFSTGKPEAREGYKIFTSPQTGQEIQIPVSLFELSTKVKAHYQAGEVKEIPHYEYKGAVFQAAELKEQNPKANLQDTEKMKDKAIPKEQFQGNQKLDNNPHPKGQFQNQKLDNNPNPILNYHKNRRQFHR